MCMRKNIYVTNNEVLKAMESSENASKLIEVAILHYMKEEAPVTRAEVREMIIGYLKDMVVAAPISNQNYLDSRGDLAALSNTFEGE